MHRTVPLMFAAILGMATAAPAFGAPGSAPIAATPAASSAPPSRAVELEPVRLRLTGDPLTSTPFEEERVGVVPFGKFLNAIPLQTVQHGVTFAAELENCAVPGCIISVDDVSRVLIARKGVADACRILLYDDGFGRSGTAALSEENQLAIPVAGPHGEREIWLLRRGNDGWRMRKRYPHDIGAPLMLRFRDEDIFAYYQGNTGTEIRRLRQDTGRMVSATPYEPYWYSCVGGVKGHWAVGAVGEQPGALAGYQVVEMRRPGDPAPAMLELTAAVRPKCEGGFASPERVQVDCSGRVCVVSAFGDEIWCLRFGADGQLQNAGRVGGAIAGNARSVQMDERGRFYYLETEMGEDQMTPRLLHLIRLK